MVKQRKLGLLFLVLALLLVLPFVGSVPQVEADNNLEVMKTGGGSTLYYRNSNEKVYMLSEYDYPTAEYRAVWVSTFVSDIPAYTTEEKFKADATKILDNLVRMGMNAMVFHVRTHNNALYNSDLNPIATWWTLVDFDEFDPLTWLIDETHKRGIEFHAWMNPYRITDGYVGEAYPEGHPCLDPTQVLTSSSGAKILDPGSERVQDFIVDTCMEFLDRYDADAIHFDDYFYISGVASNVSANQKRANVDAFIKKLSDEMYEMNIKEGRAVQLGISPSGIYRNGSYSSGPSYDENGTLKSPVASNTSGFAHYDDYLYSDTKKWVDEEWIDYITPQTYWGIEHTVASFVELSRWWSWAVRYKKVNLYLGMGIYMADESGSSATYWKKNQNEVKNQLLNSGQYDEVKGICYYKYNSLLSSNTIIKNGVDLITNDYYAKRIPGAVIQRYATTLPSVKVSNIKLSSGTLSWDKIDNVFGYMVYQVPKGTQLDVNNIDHVLVYTQDTSVSGIDTSKYDYYVSSVNRANVKSTPVQYGAVVLKDYEEVIELINSLPAEISLNEEAQVVAIRQKFAALSAENQTKVTNLQVLLNAEHVVQSLKVLQEKAQGFIENLDTRINTSRVLPVEANMRWSYVNPNDANKYNISTGKRLINFIASMPLDLYLEVTDGTYTHKEIVTFDLSMLQETQIGLYYRNDPSALSEHHVGSHTGQTSFIGWADATLTLGNYVLFLARDSYHELTSNNIPECYWTSCGGTYVNKSSSNITMTLKQAFETESPTYGYFVIGANKQVKRVSTTSPGSEAVTLQPGEVLYIVRYLDRLINNTPFTAVDQIAVGTSAYITKYSEVETTPQDEGEAVVALINTIPTTITLATEELLNTIQEAYDALSEEAKTYVSNLDVLTQAKQKVAELKEELAEKKAQGINELKAYPNMDNYSLEKQVEINEYISEATQKINSATSIEAVDTLVTSYKALMDAVLTIEEELVEYKDVTLNDYLKTIDLSLYSDENQELIHGYIETLKTAVSNATTKMGVDQAIDNTKTSIANLKTVAEELAIYRNELKNEISNYGYDRTYSSSNQALVDNIIYNACAALNKSQSFSEMVTIVANAKEEIDKVPTKDEELVDYRNNAIVELDQFVSKYPNPTDIVGFEELFSSKIADIHSQNSIAKIDAALENAKKEIHLFILNYMADMYIQVLNSLLENYDTEEQTQAKALINSIKTTITVNTTVEELEAKYEQVVEQIGTMPTKEQKLKAKIEETKDLLDALLEDVPAEKEAKIKDLIENSYAELDKAKSVAEVDEIYNDVVDEYNEIINEEEKPATDTSCALTSIRHIIALTTMISLLAVIIRKRK